MKSDFNVDAGASVGARKGIHTLLNEGLQLPRRFGLLEMKFELIKKMPVVEENSIKLCDTGFCVLKDNCAVCAESSFDYFA